MESTSTSWYGWVPILSGDLFLPDQESVIERANNIRDEIAADESEGTVESSGVG